MRKYLLFTIFFAQVIISAGQIKTRNIRGLKLDTLSEHALALPMSFDNRFFTNEPDLPQALITKVVLVYTQHKLSPGFNQALLNKNRWEELFEKYQEYLDSFQQQISIKDDELYRLTEQFNLINTKNNRNRKKTEKKS